MAKLKKANELDRARKRRAKILADWRKSGATKTAMALKHGVSQARMWEILNLAQKDENLP